MKEYIYIYLLLLWFLFGACSETETSPPVALTWSSHEYNNTFVIKNISGKEVGNNWTLYFSQLPRQITHVHTDQVKIEVVNANYFKIYPTKQYKKMAPGDSIILNYEVSNLTPNLSQQPEGCYWVYHTDHKESTPIAIDLGIEQANHTSMAVRTYNFNQKLNTHIALKQADILPSVKQVVKKKGKMTIPSRVSLLYSNELSKEANILKQKLEAYGLEVAEVAPITIRLNLLNHTDNTNTELYKLDIDTERIIIEGATPHGVFNGIQTLLAMTKNQQKPETLECLTITDYPDLHYRGFMLDIARNFTTVSNLKTLIDILASYKINVLHFHFSDDEGWRLQIPGLEELTTVGGRRGHTKDEAHHLYPGYDGGFDPDATTSGNGYYTREEFIDLIKYAAARHVSVIPEIESPGHARAAIVAMKARYNKYIGTDAQKACEYLLSEPEDTSTYVSAQSYTDNVMNVALPSTYNFVQKVIAEIKNMYAEAGVPLPAIHIGGDEVPAGAWEKSPACNKFMKEKGIADAHGLFEYFYVQVTNYMHQQGVKFSGWQEVAMRNAPATDRQLMDKAAGIHCWNTVPDWGGDEIPYQTANKGYPVILCNVNNFYMDLAYNPDYRERGHSWAGYVDESKAFSMLPFSVYRSARTDIAGNPTNLDELAKGKEPLHAANKQHIKGVQAQLFTETIRDYQWVEYYLFPKILGLVERGWNAHPLWENMRGRQEEDAFGKDLSHFYALISDKEMPWYNTQGINYRLPTPGLCVENGYLHANTSVRGAKIHYTTDGTEPTQNSPVWTKVVKHTGKGTVKACIFYLNKKSLTTTLSVEDTYEKK